jgi:hypothetical protein
VLGRLPGMPEFTRDELAVAEVPQAPAAVDSGGRAQAATVEGVAARARRRPADSPDGDTGCGHDRGHAEQALEAEALEKSAHALRALGVPEFEVEGHLDALDRIRVWLGRPLWEMTSADADVYFGEYTRCQDFAQRVAQAQALARYFIYLVGEQGSGPLTGLGLGSARCPLDALNWPIPLGHARVGPESSARAESASCDENPSSPASELEPG